MTCSWKQWDSVNYVIISLQIPNQTRSSLADWSPLKEVSTLTRCLLRESWLYIQTKLVQELNICSLPSKPSIWTLPPLEPMQSSLSPRHMLTLLKISQLLCQWSLQFAFFEVENCTLGSSVCSQKITVHFAYVCSNPKWNEPRPS